MKVLKKFWKWLRGLLCWRRKAGRVVPESETGLAGYELVVDGIDVKDWEVVEAGPSQWNRFAGLFPVLGENGVVRFECVRVGDDGYVCAAIKSKEAYGDGKLEVEARFKGGAGTWPAIWMSHPDGSRDNFATYYEVDLSEYYERREKTDSTYHFPASMRGDEKFVNVKSPIIKDGWNRFECKWDEQSIDVVINGETVLQIKNNGDGSFYPVNREDRTFQIILSMQAGNRWLSPVDLGELPLWMDVRNFKLWRKV